MKVLVAGGGIGGLGLALSLHQAGLDVRVFESVRAIEAIGVGINLQPNAVRELCELGLGDALAETGIPTAGLSLYNKHGQLIWTEPRGKAAGYDWPQYSIHRGELLVLLLKAAETRLGPGKIFTGHHLTSFEQDASGVTAHFTDRRSGNALHTERGDILVGADGIHSAVRAHYYPDQGDPVFGGQLMWRAAVETDTPLLDGKTFAMIGHRDHKFVAYPMSARSAARGKCMVNWIAERSISGTAPPRSDWNRRVDKAVFADYFKDWRFPWIDVPALIAATDAVFEFPKVDREPVKRWSFERVTLLGDAAHPMHPTGSQAGSQAIVDGRVLTRHLLQTPNVVEALKAYEAERLPPMTEITVRNRQLGPEMPMQMAEERAPNGFARVEDVISQAEMQGFSDTFKRTAGFDRDFVNSRKSILLDAIAARGS
jgi:2-polyprenyl-6-methoxyphenol hydroxylase-like FAD-dependent oxidoreductase